MSYKRRKHPISVANTSCTLFTAYTKNRIGGWVTAEKERAQTFYAAKVEKLKESIIQHPDESFPNQKPI